MIPGAGKGSNRYGRIGFPKTKNMEKMKSLEKNADTSIIYADNSMYLIVPYPSSYITGRGSDIHYYGGVVEDELETALKAMASNPDEGAALYDFGSGNIIATGYNDMFHEEIRKNIFDDSGAITENAKIITN